MATEIYQRNMTTTTIHEKKHLFGFLKKSIMARFFFWKTMLVALLLLVPQTFGLSETEQLMCVMFDMELTQKLQRAEEDCEDDEKCHRILVMIKDILHRISYFKDKRTCLRYGIMRSFKVMRGCEIVKTYFQLLTGEMFFHFVPQEIIELFQMWEERDDHLQPLLYELFENEKCDLPWWSSWNSDFDEIQDLLSNLHGCDFQCPICSKEDDLCCRFKKMKCPVFKLKDEL